MCYSQRNKFSVEAIPDILPGDAAGQETHVQSALSAAAEANTAAMH
jgi:hypothetical protein